ncbi:hypothetical protein RB195_020001 [Necator americanus]|uniref:Uncharacterized protein n=1 Tax=Necator americanus TaxID=51031 RepID=A0ABR1CJ64_NECAM
MTSTVRTSYLGSMFRLTSSRPCLSHAHEGRHQETTPSTNDSQDLRTTAITLRYAILWIKRLLQTLNIEMGERKEAASTLPLVLRGEMPSPANGSA